ncbi:hypothetical protein PR202_ga26924 [Eleusine coracana subsp. coracana]|uniref:Pentatricopeptide repeat-containing protein n=1 Tax=Eleusine coracana subsp. coracana TaxID=191504 RepID=A0AAV5DFE1_ELECO|nr:hypothetical protein PR202_ga26924 [Eleusine coracana subsp. coracana]
MRRRRCCASLAPSDGQAAAVAAVPQPPARSSTSTRSWSVRGFLSDPSARSGSSSSPPPSPSAAASRHARRACSTKSPTRTGSCTTPSSCGAAHSGAPRDAVSLYARMARNGNGGVRPDKLTFPFVLRACAAMGSGAAGAQVHAHVVKAGCECDAFVKNALIGMHASCGDLGVAAALFDRTACGDAVAWSAMISGCARRGDLGTARQLFDESPAKDLVSWNVMITALLSACADSGDLDVGQRLHSYLSERFSRTGLSTVIGNALIDMYAKCGQMKRALEVFRSMRDKGCLKLQLNHRRIGIAWACLMGGMVDKGREYFNLMQQMYRIEPNIKHYGCMVDMLSRAGLLKEAFEFISKMKTEPNSVIWRTLLGACRTHGEIELAKYANQKLLQARSDASGDYVLLSNIYASVGEWFRSEKMRQLMDDSGVNKEAGHAVVDGN